MSANTFGRILPLWYQTSEALRAEINDRIASDDLRLATESQLSKDYGVSLMTVRQALAALESEGLISRTRGRGTLINPAAVRGSDLKVIGTLPSVWNIQFKQSPKLLARRKIKTPPELIAAFGNAPLLTFMQRLRHEDGKPINYCVNYILPEYGELITKTDLAKWPISRILKDKLGVQISRVDYVVKALGASGEIAEYLALKPGAPVLFFTASVYDQHGNLVEIGQIYYESNSFQFDVSVNMK
jgi:GntR family transcriptional regulator